MISHLLFSSCEKGDNYNSPNPILGTWKIENYTTNYFEGYIDPVFSTEVITNLEVYDGPEEGEEQYLNFIDNNTLLDYYYLSTFYQVLLPTPLIFVIPKPNGS